MNETVEQTQEITNVGKANNPAIFLLSPGEPINPPDDVRIVLDGPTGRFLWSLVAGANGRRRIIDETDPLV